MCVINPNGLDGMDFSREDEIDETDGFSLELHRE